MAKSTGAKVADHPDLDEIVRLMNSGWSVRKLEKWLKERYPNDASRWLSYATLQTFRRDILDLSGDALEQLKKKSDSGNRSESKEDIIKRVRQTPAYQAIIEGLSDDAISVQKELFRINRIVKDRIRDHIETLGEGRDLRVDKQLLKWVEQLRLLAQDYAKLVQGRPDHIVEHNININVMNDYMGLAKEAFIQTLQEVEPSKVPRLLELLDEKLKKLKPQPKEDTAKEYFKEVKALDAKYEEVSQDIDLEKDGY